MPCMCWYEPSNRDQKVFKKMCSDLVELIKELEKEGDPLNCSIHDAHKLIDHLYDPGICTDMKEESVEIKMGH